MLYRSTSILPAQTLQSNSTNDFTCEHATVLHVVMLGLQPKLTLCLVRLTAAASPAFQLCPIMVEPTYATCRGRFWDPGASVAMAAGGAGRQRAARARAGCGHMPADSWCVCVRSSSSFSLSTAPHDRSQRDNEQHQHNQRVCGSSIGS